MPTATQQKLQHKNYKNKCVGDTRHTPPHEIRRSPTPPLTPHKCCGTPPWKYPGARYTVRVGNFMCTGNSPYLILFFFSLSLSLCVCVLCFFHPPTSTTWKYPGTRYTRCRSVILFLVGNFMCTALPLSRAFSLSLSLSLSLYDVPFFTYHRIASVIEPI